MAIYKVSFPSPNPAQGEDPYDTLDTIELSNTKINDESIRAFNEEKTIHVIKYEYFRRNKMPENTEEIFIKATCDSIDGTLAPEEKLDIQTFVDEVAKGVYARKTPDSSDYIIEKKTKLKTVFANRLLEAGTLAINSRYNSFGYILVGEDIVGTFENINITSENEFTIDDVQSIVDLQNINDISMQVFIEKQHTFLIMVEGMRSENTARLDSINKADIEIPEEVLNIKSKEEYSSEEDFLAARRALINTNVVADTYNMDDMEDLF